jgi:hypothetical protein
MQDSLMSGHVLNTATISLYSIKSAAPRFNCELIAQCQSANSQYQNSFSFIYYKCARIQKRKQEYFLTAIYIKYRKMSHYCTLL